MGKTDVNVSTMRNTRMRFVGKTQSFHALLAVTNTTCLYLTFVTFPSGVRLKTAQTLGLRVLMTIWAKVFAISCSFRVQRP